MAGTSVSGIGTGIDTKSIVTALVNAEKAPKQNQIDTQTKKTQTTLSAIGSLKSALETFQSALDKLNTTSSFVGLSAKSSDEKVATVTSSNSAVNGSYKLNVSNLASSSKVATQVMATDATTSAAGKLTITQGSASGTGTSYDIDIPAGASLTGVRDAINQQLQTKGITANILSDANGSRLVLSSTTTGAGTDLSISTQDSALSSFQVDGTVQTKDANGNLVSGFVDARPKDASFTIDGLAMTSASNTLDKTISGLTVNLVSTGSSTVEVSTDKEGLKKSVQTFVDAYNALISTTSSLTKVSSTVSSSSTTTSAAALTGDATVRSLLSDIRNELVNTQSSSSTGISMLSQLGIMTKQDGTLEVNSTKLDKALTENYSAVSGFFTGDTGILKRLDNKVDSYTASKGILDNRKTSLQSTLDSLSDQQDALDLRIENLQTALSAKYNAMDSLVAQLNATSTSVLTTLNALNNRKE
ncbi:MULTISPECIES: flagellar filament capping protein FliD [Pseudomonas]|uniref:Flagellar hook-associated protein 2 n=1 Tax=Pseudomonas lutea TaxID=243924 RepID=A0A9X8QJD7_9PSED|nr:MULTISPECIES: flagellar filament capping protein FliD [Pseudomonas]MCG7371260.1 flagellar filament capping protein FliD [Pseudomonas luteola]SEQ48235.1 flagellar hook-associated protein 2 [Pseudomonas lutea]